MAEKDVRKIALLLQERNAIDEKIAGVTKRPMKAGHLGEWIVAQIVDIELETSAQPSFGVRDLEPGRGPLLIAGHVDGTSSGLSTVNLTIDLKLEIELSDTKATVRRRAFISYVREDASVVDLIANVLREAGVDVWLDRTDISPGDRWQDAIRAAIGSGDYFIACFSPAYAAREKTYMNEELLIGIEELRQRPRNRRWFIPVMLQPCEIPDHPIGAGETLRNIQALDFSSGVQLALKRLLMVLLGSAQYNSTVPIKDESAPGRGGHIAILSPSSTIRLRDASDRKFDSAARSIALHRVTKRRVEIYDVDTGHLIASQPVPWTASVAFRPDGQSLAIGSGRTVSVVGDIAGTLERTTLETPLAERTSAFHGKPAGYFVRSLTFDLSGTYLAVHREHQEGTHHLPQTKHNVYVLTPEPVNLTLQIARSQFAHFGHGSNSLITAEKVFSIWSVADRRPISQLSPRGMASNWASAQGMGRVFASSSDGLSVWDHIADPLHGPGDYVLREDEKLNMRGVVAIQCDRAGAVLAVATPKSVRVFDFHNNELIMREDLLRAVTDIAVSEDGQFVSVACNDTVRVWSAQTRTWLYQLDHEGPVRNLIHRQDELVTASSVPGKWLALSRWPIRS